MYLVTIIYHYNTPGGCFYLANIRINRENSKREGRDLNPGLT